MRFALLGGLALTAVAIALTLSHPPMTVSLKNGPYASEDVILATPGSITATGVKTFCQPRELLPRDTTAVQPWLEAVTGPRVSISVRAGGRTITSGERGSGWTGRVVTVPVTPISHSVADVTVCVAYGLGPETVEVLGFAAPTPASLRPGGALPGRALMEYLRPSKNSWASELQGIADRMQLGRTTTGGWIVVLALGLLAAVVALTCGLLLRALP